MSDTVISVEGLSKRYQLGRKQKHRNFGEACASALFAPFKRLAGRGEVEGEEFWALKDVSFEVQRGDVVGIIGRNGAGKSTLLKILSHITPPTSGGITLHGRVASLLEVGTGFHPELTGRENIYLNGAMLGMRREEIRRKFDEIVAFSEVEQFLETPVKRYSSGMYVRLAFAVAAHLEPEILVVDEVLAVGDAEFQKKCLGKMQEVSTRAGRTVLFVSHNMAAVQSLCSRGIFLCSGSIALAGSASEAVTAYINSTASSRTLHWDRPISSVAAPPLTIEAVTLFLAGTQPRHRLRCVVRLKSHGQFPNAFVAVDVHDPLGAWLMQALPRMDPFIRSQTRPQNMTIDIDLPPLIPGSYLVSVWVGNSLSNTIDWAREVVQFEITDSPTLGRTAPHSPERGFCVPVSSVSINETDQSKRSPGAPAHE